MAELFVDSVTHNFGNREVLSGVYINCKIGEVVGLLGRNGSGKSTLLQIIFGSVKAHFKFLKLNDEILSIGYKSKNIAYLPQDQFIPDSITISQAIDIFCKKFKIELLKIELVSKNLHSKLYSLSGGERKFLECLIIIYSDAQFILLDEPFSQLSPIFIEEIKMHIESLKAYKGFIITDHYYKSVLDFSDRIILLHNRRNYNIKNIDDLILHGYLP